MNTATSKHADTVRGFIWSNRAWYASDETTPRPSISIGMYGVADDGSSEGTTGEFSVEWVELGSKLTPKLACFDDAWDALLEFQDVLREMKKIDGQDIDDIGFVQMLKRCGVKAMTAYDRPDRYGPSSPISALVTATAYGPANHEGIQPEHQYRFVAEIDEPTQDLALEHLRDSAKLCDWIERRCEVHHCTPINAKLVKVVWLDDDDDSDPHDGDGRGEVV